MKTTAILLLSTLCASAWATPGLSPLPIEDADFNQDGVFIECTLQDGRHLLATDSLVAVEHEILSKNLVRAESSHTAEYLTYVGPNYKAVVAKQFCAREGIQAIEITHLTGEGGPQTKPKGTVESLRCVEKNTCR
jgi:hypothetical protein